MKFATTCIAVGAITSAEASKQLLARNRRPACHFQVVSTISTANDLKKGESI